MMLRTVALTFALMLGAGTMVFAQLPPQPPPVGRPLGHGQQGAQQGNDAERAACHPDVVRYCKQFLREDGQDDVFAILGCLQSNRVKISNSCQQVLASHGQ